MKLGDEEIRAKCSLMANSFWQDHESGEDFTSVGGCQKTFHMIFYRFLVFELYSCVFLCVISQRNDTRGNDGILLPLSGMVTR